MPNPDALQQTAGFLKARQSQVACNVIVEFLEKNPKSETWWLMLSHAVQNHDLQ